MQSNIAAETTCIPKTRFIHLVREITETTRGNRADSHDKMRFERDALVALQFVTESFITMVFEMAYVSAI
jgi:histone H3/H4